MNRIFVDLEMHPMEKQYKEQRAVTYLETIEIGAVKLDENNKIISRFKEYVKPRYSKEVYKRYEKLTGITTEMLVNAPSFEEVLPRFIAWCGIGYEIFSWSESDILQLKAEMQVKEIIADPQTSYMFDHWFDFQKEYSEIFHLSHPLSLEKAVDLAGITFEGRAHDGLIDAENTAHLYVEAHDSEGFQRMREVVEDAFSEHAFTMSEIFDFGSLRLEA